MNVPTRVPGQPALHGRGLVGGVVVHDQMDLEIVRDVALDHPQELKELPAAVPREALSDDGANGDVEGGEQRRGKSWARRRQRHAQPTKGIIRERLQSSRIRSLGATGPSPRVK